MSTAIAPASASQPSPLPWMIEAAKEARELLTSWTHPVDLQCKYAAEIIARHAPTDSREKRLEAALITAKGTTETLGKLAKQLTRVPGMTHEFAQFCGTIDGICQERLASIEAALRPGE